MSCKFEVNDFQIIQGQKEDVSLLKTGQAKSTSYSWDALLEGKIGAAMSLSTIARVANCSQSGVACNEVHRCQPKIYTFLQIKC